ncbi:MAG TPA: AsmA family protein [Terriglobales bacterium]|nr:AsmA family protein [Terriglobales bacterium]
MRKLAIILVVVCVLIVLGLAIIPQFLDVNHYHDRIQAELQNRLGRPVSLGTMKLSLLPPSLTVNNVAIGEDPKFGAGPFAKANSLYVRISLLPLLRKDIQIQALSLVNPDIQLIRNKEGQWNYSSLGQAPSAPAAPASAQQKSQPPQPQKPTAAKPEAGQSAQQAPQLSLAHLQIENGRVRMIDQQKNSQNTYENIDLTLKNFAPGKAFDIDGAVRIAGKSDQEIRIEGTAGPMANGSAIIPFDGTVDLKQIPIADLQKAANIAALEGYNGTLSGSLKMKTDNGVLNSEGSLKIDDPQIKATKLGYPISLDYKLSDDLKGDVIRIENSVLKLGPTPVTIAGVMNAGPDPAQLDMRVSTQGASISEIARLAAAAGVAFNAGTDIKGNLNANISARGASNNPALNGNLQASNVEITGGQIKQAVSVPQINLSLTPTAIDSNQFTARTGGTQLAVQFSLQNYTTQAPAMRATLQTNNANVGELLSIANAYGVTAVEGMSGSGQITLNLSAAGPLKNASAMVFNGSGSLQNASLNTPSLTKPLNVRNANMRFSQNSMTLDNLAVVLDQTTAGGNLSVRNFAAPQINFALHMDKLDLAAMQKIIVTAPETQKRASFSLIPRAYAATQEPSLLSKAVGSGTISAGQILYDQIVLNDVKSQVSLNHGVIRLDPVTSTVYGGQQTGSIVLDTRQTPTAVAVNTKLQKVDANKLVSSVSSMKETLYGLLAANANTSFRAGGESNFAQSLNGQMSLDLSNGRIAKVDVLNQLASIGRFLNASAAPKQPFTDVTKLTGTFNVVNGVAETDNLRAVIPGANLAAAGTVNLANNALNMHLTAVLSKQFSDKVGGTGIGGFMQTALANNKGELVMPILVTGTTDAPRFAPDLQQVARMKLENLVPSFNNPSDLTTGILGAVLGKKGQQGTQQQQGGLGGILGAIAGKQGQQQQQQQPQKQDAVSGNEQQQNQTQPANPGGQLGDLLNQVLNKKKKSQQQQQQQQPPPDQQQK